ncbi:MAG: adenylate kinase [Candidatus Acetothermia bacterium]
MMVKELNLVLLGGPGAGKGTQASRLVSEKDLEHLATGDILRDEVSRNTRLGKRAKEYMDKGELVPDELVIDMVRKRVENKSSSGYLFDGFPRTVEQAEALEGILELDAVIYIDVSREEVVRRLSARRVCSDCGTNFNLKFDPPSEEGVCDKCGGGLVQRDDDQPQVIEDRYDTFLKKTAPLIDYYRERGLLKEVDGEGTPGQVYQRVVDKLGENG